MKKRLVVLLTLLFAFNLFAESNSEKFWNLWDSDNYEEAEELLQNWEKKNKKDPECHN